MSPLIRSPGPISYPAPRGGLGFGAGCRPRALTRRSSSGMSTRAGAAHARSIRSMGTTQEIVDSIDARLRELNEEIKTLDAARSALDGRESRSSRRPPPSVPTGAARPNRARSRAQASTRAKHDASADVSLKRRPIARARSQRHPARKRPDVERRIRRPSRVAAVRQRRTNHVRACRASEREPRSRAQRCSENWRPPAGSAGPANAAGHAGTRSPTRTASASAPPSWTPGESAPRDRREVD